MGELQVALICLAICIGVLMLVGGIKLIAKKNAEKKGKTLDMKKLEYPLFIISFILAYGGVTLFLYYGVKWQIEDALKQAIPYAFSEQTLYLAIVQVARKGISGIISALVSFAKKLKESKNPVGELPSIVGKVAEESADGTVTDTATAGATAEQRGNEIYNEIFKDGE